MFSLKFLVAFVRHVNGQAVTYVYKSEFVFVIAMKMNKYFKATR